MKIIILLLIFLSGCSHNTNITSNSTKFIFIDNLKAIDGTYLNRGSGYKFLSNIIWNNYTDKSRLTYADFINFSNENKSITVRAIQDGCVIHESTFQAGIDFNIADGKIKLGKDSSLGSSVHVGPYFKEGIIGLDENGDIKYVSNESGMGLIFMLIPSGGTSSTEYTFNKVKINNAFSLCENL